MQAFPLDHNWESKIILFWNLNTLEWVTDQVYKVEISALPPLLRRWTYHGAGAFWDPFTDRLESELAMNGAELKSYMAT
jgi:hypothetical protein